MYDQFYHTRCSAQQSVIHQDGFTIRGSSLDADEIKVKRIQPLLARLAAYTIPTTQLDAVLAGTFSIDDSPVRLARIKTETGFLLIHSVFRSDAGKRRGNYFSHIIFIPATQPLSPAECLQTWGTTGIFGEDNGWVWEDSDQVDHEAGMRLPQWHTSPVENHHLRNDKAAYHFLAAENFTDRPHRPSLTLLPERLRSLHSKSQRREILRCIVSLYLSQQRVLLVGEPGLAALLLAAMTNLLPAELTAEMTFSTYESSSRLRKEELDIINTLPSEAESNPQAFLFADGEVALIDTYETPSFNTPPLQHGATEYANAVLEKAVTNASLESIHEFWNFSKSYCAPHRLTRSLFLEAWQRWYHINNNTNHLQLSARDQRNYLEDARTRPLLFQNHSGRMIVAEYVVRNVITWWPEAVTSLDESQRNDLFHCISRSLLRHARRGEVDYQCINRCLDHVLSTLRRDALLAFCEYTTKHLEADVKRLPLELRLHFLICFAKSPDSLQPASCWLTFIDEMELMTFLKKDRFPENWKVDALAHYLKTRASSDLIGQRLLTFPPGRIPLLNKAFQITSHTVEAAPPVIRLLLASFGDSSDRARFCLMLLRTTPIEKDERFCKLLIQCFHQLSNSDVDWRIFFDDKDRKFFLLLKRGIELQVQDIAHLLDILVASLQPSAINRADRQYAMLDELITLSHLLHKTWADTTDEGRVFIDRVKDWSSLLRFAINYKDKPDWDRLQQAIKNLNYRDPFLFGRLIERLDPNPAPDDKGEYLHVVSCAKAAYGGPQSAEITELFLSAFESIAKPDLLNCRDTKDKMMAHLLNALCVDGERKAERVDAIEKGLKAKGKELPLAVRQKMDL